MHTPIAVPSRITIDFRSDLQPGHGWIIGATPGTSRRVEVLAVTDRPAEVWMAGPSTRRTDGPMPSTFQTIVDCCCPEFCELDHSNE